MYLEVIAKQSNPMISSQQDRYAFGISAAGIFIIKASNELLIQGPVVEMFVNAPLYLFVLESDSGFP